MSPDDNKIYAGEARRPPERSGTRQDDTLDTVGNFMNLAEGARTVHSTGAYASAPASGRQVANVSARRDG